jgi:hypothetical protein
MLAMVVLIALNQFAQTVKMVIVVVMHHVYAKSDGKEPPVTRRPARLAVRPMVASATTVTACAQLVLLVFNVRPRLMCVPMAAPEVVFVMSGANNATAMTDSAEMIALFDLV